MMGSVPHMGTPWQVFPATYCAPIVMPPGQPACTAVPAVLQCAPVMQALLAMVPRPVKAVMMLFPISDKSEAAKQEEEDRLKDSGQKVSPSVWFSKQTVSNACGTVAMLHAYANNPDVQPLADSFLARFLEATKSMTPAERARFLEDPQEGEPNIEDAHAEAAQDGQSAPPPEEEQARFAPGHTVPCGRVHAG